MRYLTCVFIATLLTGCAGRPVPVALAPVAPPPLIAEASPPAPTPLNDRLSPAATLWHLRAGLNVAALACRGPDEAAIVARYNALIARHADALKAAEASYAAEYQTAGGAWRDRYDDEMTRLYNFFSQARGRGAFCEAADRALTELDVAPADTLQADAPVRLATLDQPFAPPWLAVDPVVLGVAPAQLAAR